MKSPLISSHQTLQAKEGRFRFPREPGAHPGRAVGDAWPALGPGVPLNGLENLAGRGPGLAAQPTLRYGGDRGCPGALKPPPGLRRTGVAEDAREQVTRGPNQDDIKKKNKVKGHEKNMQNSRSTL